MMSSSFPEELLDAICRCSVDPSPDPHHEPPHRWMQAFSRSCKQFRRIAYPHLFSHVVIRSRQSLEGILESDCLRYARFITFESNDLASIFPPPDVPLARFAHVESVTLRGRSQESQDVSWATRLRDMLPANVRSFSLVMSSGPLASICAILPRHFPHVQHIKVQPLGQTLTFALGDPMQFLLAYMFLYAVCNPLKLLPSLVSITHAASFSRFVDPCETHNPPSVDLNCERCRGLQDLEDGDEAVGTKFFASKLPHLVDVVWRPSFSPDGINSSGYRHWEIVRSPSGAFRYAKRSGTNGTAVFA